ncbi:MAG: S8 family serine peptidase [Candidatus Krumholzibacteria bacterium]|nr:S8 family serine peptidase [Candidatus Krumholzibacteria bacterium]MDP6668544.1 S8 family serine peptidase [Candidatus Krumholzibacteria bacterium]MDP7021796.1 S8 family serine peptidase [Candidatus Krumholzibacteria bacterium]
MRRFILLILLVTISPGIAADNTLLAVLDNPDILSLDSDGSFSARDAGLSAVLESHGLFHYEYMARKDGALNESDRRFLILESDLANFSAENARRDLQATGAFAAVAERFSLKTLTMPNDPMTSSQWAVTSGSAGIHLQQAWDVCQGSSASVIAILDTGVDVGHEDLAGNMWQNPGEIPNNGQDDDGNGYVDDYNGWDAGDNDKDPSPVPYLEGGIDVGFHGTHCAGCASATTSNGTGIAGTGWDCSIMGVKMVESNVGMTDVAITNSFLYVVETKPDVISMSFGGPDQGGMAAFMQELIDMADAEDIVCVAAAGNNGDSQMMYPGACNHVISVGATNSSNQRASFSTYGTWVDIAAPGEQIWSCVQSNYQWDFLTELLFMLMYGYDGINPYMYCDGTSMACPIVAGVAGMVRSINPYMDSDQMDAHLSDTGDYVNYDHPIGKRVNAYNAVNDLSGTGAGDTPPATRLAGNYPNPFNPKTTIRFELDKAGPVLLEVYDVGGRLLKTLENGSLPAGPQERSWDGRDNNGRAMASGVYFAKLHTGDRSLSHRMVLLQ